MLLRALKHVAGQSAASDAQTIRKTSKHYRSKDCAGNALKTATLLASGWLHMADMG